MKLDPYHEHLRRYNWCYDHFFSELLKEPEWMDRELQERGDEVRRRLTEWASDLAFIVCPLSPEDHNDDHYAAWVDNECEGDFTFTPQGPDEEYVRIHFELDHDAVMFMLNFGGRRG